MLCWLLALGFLLQAPQDRAFQEARERMWWAPTAEDWKKPCLIHWQRTWDDAVALARRTGKPILICVNMDGEIASEHYAGVRYRQPEIARIYEPYICVIASVYRHSPRDYDEEGRRIPCPRFGSVTCGEHIAIEPILYEKFMDGKRIAPRHIMVELDGAETYDVYYALDTDSVFRTIREGVADRPPSEVTDVAPRTLVERVAYPDDAERTRLEREYLEGDGAQRRRLIRAALEAGGKASPDLLRLAIFDLDVELNRLARLALARATSEGAIDLINEALRAPMSAEERDSLIAALERLGERFPRARTLATVHRGLAVRSDALDAEEWTRALAGTEYPAPRQASERRTALEYRLEARSRAVETHPDDPQALIDLAEASLELAVDPEHAVSLSSNPHLRGEYARLFLQDAREAALGARSRGASGWRAEAVLALTSYYLGETEAAYRHAEVAAKELPPGEQGWNAMAVLALFAQARREAIQAAVRAKQEWPKEWLTDVNAAYAVLARHPLGTDLHVAAHNDFLRWLGAFAQAEKVLDEGLRRFPDSPELHRRLRGRVLWEKGATGLEDVYEGMLQETDGSDDLEWFAGYASLVAAEVHRRAAELDRARDSYARAIALYERALASNPEARESCDHYIAMAHAGRARIALLEGDLEGALAELEASFARKPDAAASLDGLGLSAVATARTLRARCAEAGRVDLVDRVQRALEALHPRMLEPPAFEQGTPRWRPGTRGDRR